ncbi:protein kinase domain-containing protein [Pengzhenrongella frigida]|uniref:non-specific serine/threonine protein kinase n=1 Tax=Pengzhenrongella frigida TaxID=1259133 RepID=A0A4Q5MXE4_9MICO|nr:hypothetical protein [Cellulomonas sp. HLT2-17]RYV50285.1 hypothetical protein EUA98_14290 [Cellulomonas sp. HLT2-17]
METDLVPPDLAAALRAAGYRVGGPVGVGSHGPAWAAVGHAGGSSAGTRVVATVLTVPAGSGGTELRRRLVTLRALTHDHLAEIVDVVPIDGAGADLPPPAGSPQAAQWAVLLAEVPGVNLATLLAARPPLADGEVVTLVVPLAQALAALHDAGLVHGDVSPANVVVRPDGRPVLVDLLGALTGQAGTRDGRGTPAFAAPEVERGHRPGPGADVHALARVALAGLAPGGHPGLRSLIERACAADPGRRPSAADLADRCYAAVAPEPLALPDAAVLARTTLARLAGERGPRSAVTIRPAGSRHRAARRGPGAVQALVAAGAVLTCAAVVVALIARGPAVGSADARTAAPTPSGGVDPSGAAGPADGRRVSSGPADPVAAAKALTERRAVLLAADDPDALAEVEVVGSDAQRADLAMLAGVRAAGQRIRGLSAEVASVRLVDAGVGEPLTEARVEVSSALTAHRRVAADGTVAAEIPAQPARTVVLTMAWTSAGWRVVQVAGSPTGAPVDGVSGTGG